MITIYSSLIDKPEWSSTIDGGRDQFFGFISGVANLTCEVIAEPPAEFTWYRIINPRSTLQLRTNTPVQMDEKIKYEPITNKSYPSAQIVNEGGRSTLMVNMFKRFKC